MLSFQVLNEIAQHKIKIYEFPDPEDDEEAKLQKKLKVRSTKISYHVISLSFYIVSLSPDC